jgi:hypothetical protein
VKIWTVTNDAGFSENLDPGTTKAEAELVLAALGDGWKLTSMSIGPETRQRPKSAYKKRKTTRNWPMSSTIPRESALYRALPTERRVRMNEDPVVTMEYNPTNRPVVAPRTDHGSRCYCDECQITRRKQ